MKGHAVQGLSVVDIPHRLRASAQVRCNAFGIEVWAPAEFEQERGMLERGILAFACPTCGRGLVVDLIGVEDARGAPTRRRGVRGTPLDPVGGRWDRGTPSIN